MRLSAEMYDQVLAALRSDSRGGKDKRREPRVGLAGEAKLVAMTDTGKRIADSVRVRDVSRGGIGLISNQQLISQQRFVLQLRYQDDEPLWLVCFTAYCRAIDGGRFTIGAKIQQLLKADQIPKAGAKAGVALAGHSPIKPKALAESDIARISKAILG
jgi:hypothetical protein